MLVTLSLVVYFSFLIAGQREIEVGKKEKQNDDHTNGDNFDRFSKNFGNAVGARAHARLDRECTILYFTYFLYSSQQGNFAVFFCPPLRIKFSDFHI